MMENRSLDSKARADGITKECAASPIDLLPIELLERVIHLGATDSPDGGPNLKWVYIWRQVSRKWAFTINGCPSLWSYIGISGWYGIEILKHQLAKSGTVPLDIAVSLPPGSPHNDESMQHLIDHAHRWRSISISFYWLFWEGIAMLDSSFPRLEVLSLTGTPIRSDCKFLSLGSTQLRKLALTVVRLPKNFNPPLELQELYLNTVLEFDQRGASVPISMWMLHRFLQGSPGLRSLDLDGLSIRSTEDDELPPVDLPKLQEVRIADSSYLILHLFRAQHCAQVHLGFDPPVWERPPLMAWATLVHTLKRAEELEIIVRDTSLHIRSNPDTVGLMLECDGEDDGDSERLTYSILEDILNETERDSPFSATIKLALFTTHKWKSDFDAALKVIELLQTPISEPSGLTRQRLPHLDTLHIPDDNRPFQPYHVFEQARQKRGGGSQAPRAIKVIRVPWDQVNSED